MEIYCKLLWRVQATAGTHELHFVFHVSLWTNSAAESDDFTLLRFLFDNPLLSKNVSRWKPIFLAMAWDFAEVAASKYDALMVAATVENWRTNCKIIQLFFCLVSFITKKSAPTKLSTLSFQKNSKRSWTRTLGLHNFLRQHDYGRDLNKQFLSTHRSPSTQAFKFKRDDGKNNFFQII